LTASRAANTHGSLHRHRLRTFFIGHSCGNEALGVSVAELFTADEVFKDVNSVDKTLMEKISLIELLDKKEKAAFFTMLDALVAKKKLKDNLTSALQLTA
jgi:hypothetical protein